MDENGSTLVPIPREGPLDEDEASSLTAWAQGYGEVRKNLRDSVTGRGYFKSESVSSVEMRSIGLAAAEGCRISGLWLSASRQTAETLVLTASESAFDGAMCSDLPGHHCLFASTRCRGLHCFYFLLPCPRLLSRPSSRFFPTSWPDTAPFRSCLSLPPRTL